MTMKRPDTRASSVLPKVAVLGFAMANAAAPRQARAYYALGFALLSTTTTGVGLTIAGGVYLTIRSAEDDDEALATPGETSRRLMDVALLSTRGDLGMHMDLLLDSPTAFAQLSHELARGEGPSVDAMVQATGVPVEALQSAWATASAPVGQVMSPSDAARVLTGFLVQIGPQLVVPKDATAELAWQLAREQAAGTSSADASAHRWLAGWLGVSPEALSSATAAATAGLAMDDGDAARAALYADPGPFLNAVATTLEQSHGDEVYARLSELDKAASERLPSEAREILAAASQG